SRSGRDGAEPVVREREQAGSYANSLRQRTFFPKFYRMAGTHGLMFEQGPSVRRSIVGSLWRLVR
ncbi:MAG TPA: hypothetical protein VEF04_15595, partial [Blastocatellia bacterium]|nr:hypothetical protein [Blastocatellia bacterium]